MSSIMMALEDLKKDAWRRRETDYIMPIWLPFLPTILVVVGIIAMFSSAFVGAFAVIGLIQFFMGIILIFIGAIVGIFVIYKWINRRNDHFKRQHLFLGALLDILKGLSQQKGVNTDVLIAQIERDYREAEVEETEKSAVLWVILQVFLSCLVWFYIAHFLNRDFYKHEVREDRILENCRRVLDALGIPVPAFKRPNPIPKRNTILYILLSLITLGIFSLYWVYTLTRDPNEHFKAHATWEDELIRALEAAITTSTQQ